MIEPPECQVCLGPDAHGLVTLEVPEVAPCHVSICQDCMGLVLEAMTERWRGAVEEHNEAFRRFMQTFGIEVLA